MKNNSFSSENFQFLEVMFSIYLYRRVFVMLLRFLFVGGFIYGVCLIIILFPIFSSVDT